MFDRYRNWLRFFRLTPFDSSTEEGRSNERHRRALLTGITSITSKLVAIITTFVSVPLTLNYLGPERYGLWMTISSCILMLNFADLGIGNGLLNMIADAHGKDDRLRARKYVSSAFFLLLGMAIILALVFFLAQFWIDWKKAFNLTSAIAIQEALPAVTIFAICFLLSLPCGVAQRIHLGYQDGYINGFWTIAGNVMALLSLFVVIRFRGGLPWLVLALAGSPLLAAMLNTIILFRRKRRWLMPSWREAEWITARKLMSLGVFFFILQVAGAIAYASDNVVIAHVFNQDAVTHYSIVARMFSVVLLATDPLLTPLWPAYGEAIARQDFKWVHKTFLRSLGVTLALGITMSASLILLGPFVLKIWIGKDFDVTLPLLLGMGVWTILSALGAASAMFLNGTGAIRFQTYCAIAFAIMAIVFKIIFGKLLGLHGIVIGLIVAYMIFAVLPLTVYTPRLLRELEQGRKAD